MRSAKFLRCVAWNDPIRLDHAPESLAEVLPHCHVDVKVGGEIAGKDDVGSAHDQEVLALRKHVFLLTMNLVVYQPQGVRQHANPAKYAHGRCHHQRDEGHVLPVVISLCFSSGIKKGLPSPVESMQSSYRNDALTYVQNIQKIHVIVTQYHYVSGQHEGTYTVFIDGVAQIVHGTQ